MRSALGTLRVATVAAICLAALLAGCGGGPESSSVQQESQQEAAREARQEAAQLRKAEARERREARRREARREARALAREEAREEEAWEQQEAEEREEAAEAETSECDPNYSGACLDPNVSDYDCEGGSGNGPNYTGPVEVVGNDHYGLDADGDGYACE